MGRSKKIGLDYFPFDTNLFYDIKVRKLVKYQSGKAITVYAYLLARIYETGYYLEWDKELPFVCSEITGFEEAYIQEVLRCCLTVGLFDKDLFETRGVLTSAGIQSRYAHIMRTAKRAVLINEYSLLGEDDTDKPTETNTPAPEQQTAPAAPAPRRGKGRPKGTHNKPRTDAAPSVEPAAPAAADLNPDEPSAPASLAIDLPLAAAQPRKPIPLAEVIDTLSKDVIWYEPMCMRFRLSEQELLAKLTDFHTHCQCMGRDSYSSVGDAKRHFCSWLNKTNSLPNNQSTPQPEPNDNGSDNDFGAADY